MIKDYVEKNKELALNTVRELCHIPAPSFKESRRAEYCKKWLEDVGAKGVYIDDVNNCIFPMNCEGSNEFTVIAAHLDTVFLDTENYPEFHEDDDKIYCPGAGDNTAGVAILLLTAKYFIENEIVPEKGIMFVYNSCEEGLGNLVGMRALMKEYGSRTKQFITFDGYLGELYTVAVGSHRYEVEVKTEGGHSFMDFGNKNAICELSRIITDIYSIEIPKSPSAHTTYNVGMIEGGTSINSIAQSAKMFCEYRSDDIECLAQMQQQFECIFNQAKARGIDVTVRKIGDRPCKADVDKDIENKLICAYKTAIKDIIGADAEECQGSTDANLPMSQGIASACMGVYSGEKLHTREEYLEKSSVVKGLEIGIKVALKITT